MDQDTRNKLQRATQQVRRILEVEFAEQLEGTFDVLPDGKILAEPGKHLDARQRLTWQKLVNAIEHIKASGKNPQEAVEEYTREAAFTFLNRFVALRMLESRGLLQECVSKGDASSGFKEFCGLAPGLSSLDDGAYRLYLECLFDELTVEVKVLFDRRDSASLLWPRRGALTEMLDILGQADLAGVWSEDETIGWVYQYFNSGEERKKMREESQAPRNSRELAVRNQFFTPRYVVEFLTDNTLGRIWYEMHQGQTRLVDECSYLVRRPSEVFLDAGQKPPDCESDTEQDLSQEELLTKTAYIPHRTKKDPRDLKILDPACGSGHFLLYAFDILISIYEEAWQDEASPESQVTGRRLREDYAELKELHAALPGLVLAHNLHGIEIDPRAAQIAPLALWMRGQRAYDNFGVVREDRLIVAKANIACAESMPGEEILLNDFIKNNFADTPEGRLLGQLVRKIFVAMDLASEAGSLLKIEEEVSAVVQSAKKQWSSEPEIVQQSLFELNKDMPIQKQLDVDVSGITDETFWEQVEHTIYTALGQYSHQAEGADYKRRLFSEDTARGFAFIDLCRQRYDVIVMNPPFGSASRLSKQYVDTKYKRWRHDLGPCFVARANDLLAIEGAIGALTPRTYFTLSRLADWRKTQLLGTTCLSVLADLGFKVLDEAMVEVAAYCTRRSSFRELFAVDCLGENQHDKGAFLQRKIENIARAEIPSKVYILDLQDLTYVPLARCVYWAPTRLLKLFAECEPLDDGANRVVREGVHTGDNEKQLRLWWEVPAGSRTWVPFPKGGEYCTFYSDVDLLIDWTHEGKDILAAAHGVIPSRDFYFNAGLTYTRRTASGISFRILPRGAIFSSTGPLVSCSDENANLSILSYLQTRLARTLIEYLVGGGDSAVSRGAARDFMTGVISAIPFPNFDNREVEHLRYAGEMCCRLMRSHFCFDETDRAYRPIWTWGNSIREIADKMCSHLVDSAIDVLELTATTEAVVHERMEISDEQEEALTDAVGVHPFHLTDDKVDVDQLKRLAKLSEGQLVDAMFEICPGRDTTKQFHFAHRRLELVSRVLGKTPGSLAPFFKESRDEDRIEMSWALLSWAVGVAFGRWRLNSCAPPQPLSEEYDPLSQQFQPVVAQDLKSDGTECVEIQTSDVGHACDIAESVRGVIRKTWPDSSEQIVRDILEYCGGRADDLSLVISRAFFREHVKRYSKSRRRAPIYWQLATPSASYSIWIYYHRFNKDTFFKVLNEYAKPKLDYERQKLERVRSEGGAEPTRTQRKEIEEQEKFVAELAAMMEEVERIAPLWNPNLNDGVTINFAPLWRLVPQNKPWQKECKKCWDKLVKGEHDWALLSMHLWPERVVPKCVTDASLAIAHGLENVFWEQDDRGRYQPKKEPQSGWGPAIKRLVDERTSPAVKAALESLLGAPAQAGNSKSRRRKATK